ncbi:flagellin N-terminal helical domain-containing protein [Modestobacter marinus]|uniref:flagellin N-terminal helical domain-containing protein n=1 Tax=Modestobacter marinus TaxID=477641 RepID=UPI00201B05F9|nr:flagellin [Modestobacter marinus]
MSLVVNSNIAGMNSARALGTADRQLTTSVERLSSGQRVNRAADDASGLAISENMRAQIGGLRVALRNSQDGISVLRTADGALTGTHAILHRMRDLAVQAASAGSLDDDARSAVQSEITGLTAELDRIAQTTQFNGRRLLDGSYRTTFQIGADVGHLLAVDLGPAVSAAGLGVAAVDVRTDPGADGSGTATAIAAIDAAIGHVSTVRGAVGAMQNRLEHNLEKVGAALVNTAASEGRIRDADLAQEMTALARTRVLTQAGTAMLAQANQSAPRVLQLLS